MKGIILAGGSGTRLHPITLATSKHLLPIYDKPMIYYPLSLLMLTQIQEILIITTPYDLARYERLLGNGEAWGIQIQYAVQPSPDGLAQSLIIAEAFLNGDTACLILGDNIFYGHGLTQSLLNAKQHISEQGGAVLFGYRVHDPARYGVAEFDKTGKVISIEEKPKNPKSNYAITGLYFYDANACHYAKTLKPSVRGELEITDLNQCYLNKDTLNMHILGRGYSWLDTGTHDSLIEASEFVATIEKRQGIKIGCPEEIAYKQDWITSSQLIRNAEHNGKTKYGAYLLNLLNETEVLV